jgi:hypothetical protein
MVWGGMANLQKTDCHANNAVTVQPECDGGVELSLRKERFDDHDKRTQSRHSREIPLDDVNRLDTISIVDADVGFERTCFHCAR